MDEVEREAERRHIDLLALPTAEAIEALKDKPTDTTGTSQLGGEHPWWEYHVTEDGVIRLWAEPWEGIWRSRWAGRQLDGGQVFPNFEAGVRRTLVPGDVPEARVYVERRDGREVGGTLGHQRALAVSAKTDRERDYIDDLAPSRNQRRGSGVARQRIL